MGTTDVIIRIFIAFLFGALIGIERQWRHRTAGLRTNTLVAVGSALFVILSVKISGDTSPSRIASQIVSGIGFLGAGVIMKEGLTVRGLNTAATLWCAAAVGSLAGMGLWDIGLIGTIVVLLSHLTLRPISNYLNMRPIKPDYVTCHYAIRITCLRDDDNSLRMFLTQKLKNTKFLVNSVKTLLNPDTDQVTITAELIVYGKHSILLETLMSDLNAHQATLSAVWELVDKNDD